MQRLFAFSAFAVLAGVLTGCGLSGGEAEVMRAQIPGTVPNLLSLGQGFDKNRAYYLNSSCVDGEVRSEASQTGEVQFQRDMSYEDALKMIDGTLSIGVTFPSVTVEGSASYFSKTSSNDYRETYTIFVKNSKKSLFKSGTQRISDSARNLPSASRASVCGDEYINEIDYSAYFTATLTIEYGSKEDKTKFGGSLKVSLPADIVKVEGKLQVADESTKSKLGIKIDIKQQGGDAKQLSTILQPQIAGCNGQNLAECVSGFTAAIKYAKGFNAQLTGDDAYVPVSYFTEAYRETASLASFFPGQNPIVNDEVINMRQQLENKLRTTRRLQERNGYALGLSSVLSNEDIAILNTNAEHIQNNRSDLTKALLFCYDNPYAENQNGQPVIPCLEKGALVIKNLKPVDTAVFDRVVTADEKSSDKLCDAARIYALQRGEITQREFDSYKRINYAPEYAVPHDRASGIIGWGECKNLASQL